MNKNIQRIIGNLWVWLGIGILLLVATLAIRDVSRQAAIVPNTGGPVQAQTVPEAGAQGVSNYINAHGNSSAQSVPEAGAQGVLSYINAHSNPLITEPAAQSVMDYLKVHGIQP